MKKLGIALTVLIAIFLSGCSKENTTSQGKQVITKTGKIQALKGDDYTHILITSGENVKLNSYTVKLDDYLGKEIEVQGEYSGDTLFVDTVK